MAAAARDPRDLGKLRRRSLNTAAIRAAADAAARSDIPSRSTSRSGRCRTSTPTSSPIHRMPYSAFGKPAKAPTPCCSPCPSTHLVSPGRSRTRSIGPSAAARSLRSPSPFSASPRPDGEERSQGARARHDERSTATSPITPCPSRRADLDEADEIGDRRIARVLLRVVETLAGRARARSDGAEPSLSAPGIPEPEQPATEKE